MPDSFAEPLTNAVTTATSTPAATPPVTDPASVASVTETPTETPKPDPLGTRFAKLAKQEREQRAAAEQFRTERAQHQKLVEDAQRWQKERELFKTDPYNALKQMGVGLDPIIQTALAEDGKPPVDLKVRTLEEEISKLKTELSSFREDTTKKEETQKQAYLNGVVERAKQDIHRLIESKPDDYELIRDHQAHDEVFDLIKLDYEKRASVHGPDIEPLTYEQAAQKVEDALTQRLQRQVSTTKKAASFVEALRAKQSNGKGSPPPSPTMTNRAFTPASDAQPQRKLTRDESIRAAADTLRRLQQQSG